MDSTQTPINHHGHRLSDDFRRLENDMAATEINITNDLVTKQTAYLHFLLPICHFVLEIHWLRNGWVSQVISYMTEAEAFSRLLITCWRKLRITHSLRLESCHCRHRMHEEFNFEKEMHRCFSTIFMFEHHCWFPNVHSKRRCWWEKQLLNFE